MSDESTQPSADDLHSPDVPGAAVARLAEAVSDPALRPVVARYLAGGLSPQVALMQMLIACEDAAAVRGAVDEVTAEADARSRSGDAIVRDRADALTHLVLEHGEGCGRVAAMLRAEVDHARPARTVEEGLAHVERLFDWSVGQSEEASVALYSLGSPAVLEAATAEIVGQLDRWGVLGAARRVLEIGCGIGRFERALAARVGEAHGIDVSGEMVRVARRRCAGLPNVFISKTDGRDLAPFADASMDMVFAVDTFPYIVQSGAALVERFFAEARRVLRPGGDFVILNFSYDDDDAPAAGRRAVGGLAARHGFTVLVDGERPFELWDGAAWRLVKDAGGAPATPTRDRG